MRHERSECLCTSAVHSGAYLAVDNVNPFQIR